MLQRMKHDNRVSSEMIMKNEILFSILKQIFFQIAELFQLLNSSPKHSFMTMLAL